MQLQPSDRSSSEQLPEDDIDLLFQKLKPLAMPQDLVKQILAGIEQLPVAQRYAQNVPDEVILEDLQDASG